MTETDDTEAGQTAEHVIDVEPTDTAADTADIETDADSDESSPTRSADDASDDVLAVRKSGLLFSSSIALVVLALDQISKHWALNALSDGRPRHVIWTLQWNLTFNSGMAFSRGQGIGPYIGAIAFIVVIVMLLSLRRSGRGASAVAVGLVVGGALGNLADRVFRGDGWLRGHVIDFIDVRWWPIWNVADMGVTIGGVLLVLTAVFESSSRRS